MSVARRGFSLIEILVVLLIVAIIAGLAFSAPRGEKREAYVRGAAEELASVIRQTRARAMAARSVYALAFNIENAPGSDGRVLNNRSGGHWYRILGPRPGQQYLNQELGYAPVFDRFIAFANGNHLNYLNGPWDNPIRPYLEAVEAAWVGEPRRLPPGKVRFLALTDEDRGHYRAPGDTFPPTYPRPWFGHWDPAAKRLYPWGGYAPELPMVNGDSFGIYSDGALRDRPRTKGGRTISHTGFYYEGYDGIITGSTNPSDRTVFDDTNGDGIINLTGTAQDDLGAKYRLWKAGDARPVFNAHWGDFLLVFHPDGRVDTEWMPMRRAFCQFFWGGHCYDPTIGSNSVEDVDKPVDPGKYNIMNVGPGDRISRLVSPGLPGSHVKRTGFYWITLGPDVAKDGDTFADAGAAIRSLTPAYRVGVSPFGEVRVLKVRTTPNGGGILDTGLAGADWNVRAKTDQYYQRGTLTNPDGTPRGSGPVYDRVLPEMLTERKWWWQ